MSGPLRSLSAETLSVDRTSPSLARTCLSSCAAVSPIILPSTPIAGSTRSSGIPSMGSAINARKPARCLSCGVVIRFPFIGATTSRREGSRFHSIVSFIAHFFATTASAKPVPGLNGPVPPTASTKRKEDLTALLRCSPEPTGVIESEADCCGTYGSLWHIGTFRGEAASQSLS